MPKKKTQQEQAGFFQTGKLPDYLSHAILLLGCCTLLFPIIVSNDFYYPFIFYKSLLFRMSVQAMVFLYVFLALISPGHKPVFHRILYAVLTWFGVMLFCSLPGISSNAWKSWWGEFARMDGMFAQLHLLAYFLVLTQTFRKERDWVILGSASLLGSVFMGISGLMQDAGIDLVYHLPGYERTEGATGNPDFFGAYMLLSLGLAFFFLVRNDKQTIYPIAAKAWLFTLIAVDLVLLANDAASGGRLLSEGFQFFSLTLSVLVLHGLSLGWFALRKSIPSGTAFMSILCLHNLYWIFRSQTRATAVGLAAAVTVMALLYAIKGANKPVRLASALLLLLCISAPALLLSSRNSEWVRQNPLLSRLSGTTLAERRFVAWKAGFAGMMERPVWGWGLEHYRKTFDLHAPVQLFRGGGAEHWDDRAHNIILDVGTTTGFLGLAALLAMYGLMLAHLLRSWFRKPENVEYLVLTALIVGHLVQNLFIFETANTTGLLFSILAYVTYLYGKSKAPAEATFSNPEVRTPTLREYSILAVTAAILICGYHYLVSEPRDSNLLLNYSIASEKIENPQSGRPTYIYNPSIIDGFEGAEAFNTTGRYQVREELANYVTELVREPQVPLAEKAAAAKKALAFAEKSILEDPGDVRHYMYAATLSNRVYEVLKQSNPEEANRVAARTAGLLQKAESLGPNRPQLYLDRAQAQLNAGRMDAAAADLQKAMVLDPDNPHIRFDLAIVYISAGRYGEAENELKTAKSAFAFQPADYEKLIRLYASRKRIDLAINTIKEQLQGAPKDAILMTRLAAAYKEAGDMEAARQTAQKAAALSPQVAAELDAFLKSLNK